MEGLIFCNFFLLNRGVELSLPMRVDIDQLRNVGELRKTEAAESSADSEEVPVCGKDHL